MEGLLNNVDESLIRLLLESNANVNATDKVHPGDECEGVVHGVWSDVCWSLFWLARMTLVAERCANK